MQRHNDNLHFIDQLSRWVHFTQLAIQPYKQSPRPIRQRGWRTTTRRRTMSNASHRRTTKETFKNLQSCLSAERAQSAGSDNTWQGLFISSPSSKVPTLWEAAADPCDAFRRWRFSTGSRVLPWRSWGSGSACRCLAPQWFLSCGQSAPLKLLWSCFEGNTREN